MTCSTLSNLVDRASLSTWKLRPTLSGRDAPLRDQVTVVGGKEEEGQFREKRKSGESITFKETVSSSWGVPGYDEYMYPLIKQ